MLLALRVASCQVWLQGSLSSLQPATDRLCRNDGEQIRRQGSLSSWQLCASWTRTYCRCPLVAEQRCGNKLEGWRGLPVPQAGGQRKVLLARDVRRFATPCS